MSGAELSTVARLTAGFREAKVIFYTYVAADSSHTGMTITLQGEGRCQQVSAGVSRCRQVSAGVTYLLHV